MKKTLILKIYIFLVKFVLALNFEEKCRENYFLMHQWYIQEPNFFSMNESSVIKIIKNQLDTNIGITKNNFESYCNFYNKKVDKHATYSPCNDQSYDVYSCFKKFIIQLNKDFNYIITSFINFKEKIYSLNELDKKNFCNQISNLKSLSIKNFNEINCKYCLSEYLKDNCTNEKLNTIFSNCCFIGNSIRNYNEKKINLNKDENFSKKDKLEEKKLCKNELNLENCFCSKGYEKDGNKCIDINECSSNNICLSNSKYNSSLNKPPICVNTFGKYICVQINCPPNYSLIDKKCYYYDYAYESLNIKKKFSEPKYIIYDFLGLPINMAIHNQQFELFRFKNFQNADYKYAISKINSIYSNVNEIENYYENVTDLEIDEADLQKSFYLDTNESSNETILYLKNEIKQIMHVQVILETLWHSKNSNKSGLTKLFLNIYFTT